MESALRVYDHTPGAPRAAARTLKLATERITLRELIRRRVESEVAAHNASLGGSFDGLVQPTDSTAAATGYRLWQRRMLDADEQIRVALDAFQRRGFIVLFDERHIEDLDTDLVQTGDNEITFLKLVPLIGG